MTVGVSPAYFISRFGDRFTPEQVAEGLKEIAALGYQGFQLEVFHRDTLDLWRKEGARRIYRRGEDLGLRPTQFVAHFMMKAFDSPESLRTDWAFEDMKSVLEITFGFDACRIVTIPLGPFEPPSRSSPADYASSMGRCGEKIGRLMEMVEKSGRRLALEVLPHALIGGIDGFLRLSEKLKTHALGLNFDTGHAWAAKENIALIPAKLGSRILGTHLCDNMGHENVSLRPGDGTVDWPGIIGALRAVGYQGSYDVEIICKPEDAQKEYGEGKRFMESVLNRFSIQENAS